MCCLFFVLCFRHSFFFCDLWRQGGRASIFLITFTFHLNSQEVTPSAIFWTSRGRRCRPFPPQYVPSFLSRIGFSILTAGRFSSNIADSRAHVFRKCIYMQEKVYVYAHSVIVELMKFELERLNKWLLVTFDARVCVDSSMTRLLWGRLKYHRNCQEHHGLPLLQSRCCVCSNIE